MSKSSCLAVLLLGLLMPDAFAAPVFSSGASYVTNATFVVGQSNVTCVIAVETTGDGLLDLVSANTMGTNGPGTLTVFTNNNFGGFGSNATYVVGTNLSSVTAADINGDGSMDLICSLTNGVLVVLTNNGSGVYGSNDIYVIGRGAINVVAADVNGDGYPDLITANYNSVNNGTLTVLTNNGSGVFGSNTTLTVGFGGRFVAAADINGDGHVDLISANFNGNSLTVLTNSGSGNFAVSETLSVSTPMSVAVADVNGDGLPDLICPNLNYNSTLTIFTNAGNGRFAVSSTPGEGVNGSYPDFVAAVTNLDGHGLMALVAANNANPLGISFGGTLTVLTNNGTGVFGSNTTLHVGIAPVCVAAGDFFGNGLMDLASANAGTNTLTVLSNNTAVYNATFTVGSPAILGVSASGSPTPAFILTNSLPRGMFFTDNSNGTALFGGTPLIGSGGVYTFSLLASNNVSPYFTAQKITMTVNQRPVFSGGAFATAATLRLNEPVYSIAVADVNGDGYPDLISAVENYSINSGQLVVFTNNGAGGFGSNATYNVDSFPTDVQVVTNLNGHGLMGLVVANYDEDSGNTVTVLTNNGTGVFGSNATYTVSRGPYSVIAADIYGNGRPALISANSYSGFSTLTVLTNNGWGGFGSNSAYNVGSDPECIIAADLNRNGRMDLITANSGAGTLTVLTNNGNGIFALSTTIIPNQTPTSVTAADIYGNGRPALICNNTSASTLSVFTNKGNGTFALNATLNVPASPQCVMAADVNGDGSVDLISLNSSGLLTVFTNNGAGIFGSNLTFTVQNGSGQVNGLAVADVNNDGKVDLAIANGNAGTLTVLTNEFGTNYSLFLQGSAGTNATLISGYPAPVFNTSGTPPTGITFNNGAFSGTPATFGMTVFSNVVVTATNAFGVASENYDLIAYQAPLITSPATYKVTENGTLTGFDMTLLTNDTEPNFEIFGGHDNYFPLFVATVSPTSTNAGTVTLSPAYSSSGTFTYKPNSYFTGQDGFTYTLQDSIGLTAQGTVLVTVYPFPIPGTNIFSTPENTVLTIPTTNVTANAFDPAGYPLTVSAVYGISTNGGTAGLNAGIITYTPAANAIGLDAVSYTLRDSTGGTSEGSLQVVVTAPGSPPYNVAQITSPSPGGTMGLYFTGLPNQTYYLQSATNVVGPYVDSPPPITADTNGLVTNTITLSPSTPEMFYRISAQP